jgi:hypothetical protein
MIADVVLPGMTAEDWPAVRREMLERIMGTMGTPPAGRGETKHEELRRYEAHGLEHVHIRYHVAGDQWSEAIIVIPERTPAPAVLTIHGCNYETGKDGVLDVDSTIQRAYGVELAQRGYVTFSPDQFGFGHWMAERVQKEIFADFFARWPGWSLDGVRTFEQQRAIDLLETLDFVDSSRGFGAMGNSLGGRATLHLAAMEERIAAAVPSCGLSPVCSNVYRYIERDAELCPPLSEQLTADGRAVWEYQEMLALCAPRAVLLVEPFNDPYNPDVAPVFDCYNKARRAYELLGRAEGLSLLIHGDGHDTVGEVRRYAYSWLDRFLR